MSQYKLDKTLLPPKKLFGNQTEAFIKKRQHELEIYLQTVLHHLTQVPQALAVFLDFPKYVSGRTEGRGEGGKGREGKGGRRSIYKPC